VQRAVRCAGDRVEDLVLILRQSFKLSNGSAGWFTGLLSGALPIWDMPQQIMTGTSLYGSHRRLPQKIVCRREQRVTFPVRSGPASF
jgi:hypothetical protein